MEQVYTMIKHQTFILEVLGLNLSGDTGIAG
jgi:hypothetical protein